VINRLAYQRVLSNQIVDSVWMPINVWQFNKISIARTPPPIIIDMSGGARKQKNRYRNIGGYNFRDRLGTVKALRVETYTVFLSLISGQKID